jgi:hypothetical protein
MRTAALLLACAALAACGGAPNRVSVERAVATPSAYATGPIQTACLRADRKAASRQLCGCVQAVANQSLSASDRSLAASFYADPHRAQEIRQSDNARHEVFWEKYKAYAARAERVCR